QGADRGPGHEIDPDAEGFQLADDADVGPATRGASAQGKADARGRGDGQGTLRRRRRHMMADCHSPDRSHMSLPNFVRRPSLVTQIVIGLVAGIALALASPRAAAAVGLLGTVFVSALKAVAPVLVLVLVAASIANHRQGRDTRLRPILGLYLVGTVAAALVGVAASFLFPTTLTLAVPADSALSAPGGIGEVLRTLVLQVFDNPFNALVKANYIGLLAWGIALGLALRDA